MIMTHFWIRYPRSDFQTPHEVVFIAQFLHGSRFVETRTDDRNQRIVIDRKVEKNRKRQWLQRMLTKDGDRDTAEAAAAAAAAAEHVSRAWPAASTLVKLCQTVSA